jgi:hypothetical protein
VSKKPRFGPKPNTGWFGKGRSGNPAGRPKTSRASRGSVFDVVLEKTLTVPHLGGTREIDMEEALQRRTYRDAITGKNMAMRQVVKWIMKREAWLAKHAPQTRWPEIKQYISPDPDNADAALVLLGITAPNLARANVGGDRAQLLLEPWAVQAALRRRRGGSRLSDREREEIRRCTRAPDSLQWPREING